VHPKGHVAQENWKEMSGTLGAWWCILEHVVRPEGHVAQEKWKEVSGTLGARGAS
jgi:hypothetical protein